MTFSLHIKTAEDLAAEAAEAERQAAAAEARRYLADTDWMVVRAAETGRAVPKDIAAKRAEARKVAGG